MGVSTYGGVSSMVPSYIPRYKIGLLEVTKAMCEAPLFSIKTMANSDIQPTIMFCLVYTLCESGATPNVVVRLKDTFVPRIIPHPVSKANRTMEVFKVQLESWHAVVAKLHDLPTWPTIDQTNVIPNVVFVHNEEGFFQLRGASIIDTHLTKCCWIMVFNH
jgi:hypothetical protein